MTSIAVIGAGPTGVYALARLIRAAPQRITLFETSARPGSGTPYDEASNAPEWLANIASFEIPPVVDPLAAWLARLPAPARRRLGVRGPVSTREFYPRIALGAYFVAQLRKLTKLGRKAGHAIEVKAGSRVMDIAGLAEGARVTYLDAKGKLREARFDHVLIATGHRARLAKPARHTVPAYPAPTSAARDVAVLGASLSAIDAALALAWSRGEFRDGRYVSEAPLRIEMLSRRGVLPETDFYFPFPYEPLRHCTAEALRALGTDEQTNKLDRAFLLFARELAEEDPDFARRLRLESLDAESFADAYFAARSTGAPFADLRRNLAETEADAAARRVSRWRYAILRAHETFGELTPHLSAADLARFKRGLARVFADNYAAVPPLSARRLLALHQAGALVLRRVGGRYKLEPGEAGKVRVAAPDGARVYDLVIDARGERGALAQELPFPTLRLQILANRMFAADHEPTLAVEASLRLRAGVNPVDRIYCLAAPFLLDRRPFVQGLTSAQELAETAVDDLLARSKRGQETSPDWALWRGADLILSEGVVVAAPPITATNSAC